MFMLPPYRVLVADHEDSPETQYVARALRDAGYETVYCRRDSLELLSHDALQEDVDALVYPDIIDTDCSESAEEYLEGRTQVPFSADTDIQETLNTIRGDDWQRIDGVGKATGQYLAQQGLEPGRADLETVEAFLNKEYGTQTAAPIYDSIRRTMA